MERLRKNAPLSAALGAVTAAVVGVIGNLALWFALHLIWRELRHITAGPVALDLPVMASLDGAAAALSVLALFAVFGLRLGMAGTLAGAALAGALLHLAGLA
jgi:chromate transporter